MVYLQRMDGLKLLSVDETDIDDGLEYLPESLNDFYFMIHNKKNAKVRRFFQICGERGEEGHLKSEDLKVICEEIEK